MKSKTYLIISISTLVVMLIGSSFAYFTATGKGNNATASSMSFNVSLGVMGKYFGFPILPTNNDDIMKAYNNECRDDINNGACHAYDIIIGNNGSSQIVNTTLNMKLVGLTNLSYMVLDSTNNVIIDKTLLVNEEDMEISSNITLNNTDSVSYTLIVWLTNLETPQDEEKGGSYTGSVTVSSVLGDRLTGTINGRYEGD